MKASEVIKYALENAYGYCGDGTGKSEFMCHAISDRFSTYGVEQANEAKLLIMDEIGSVGSTIMSYLYTTEADYVEIIESQKRRHDSKEAFDYRVNWWKQFIIRLESKGL